MDLLSPYEMLLHYSMERVLPPTNALARSRAAWSEDGKKYWEECRETRIKGHYKPGEHYTAIQSGYHAELAPAAWATALLVLGSAASSLYADVVFRESAAAAVLPRGKRSPPLRLHEAMDTARKREHSIQSAAITSWQMREA